MLTHLTIENFAIIDRIDVRFGPGLVALTGETGAGKSIVIDAVSALLGSRLGPDVIRSGAAQAHVEGVFFPPLLSELAATLEDLGIPRDDETLILAREVGRGGRSIAR